MTTTQATPQVTITNGTVLTRPAEPLPRPQLMSAPEAAKTLLEVNVTDARLPHIVRPGLRVRIDRGEVWLDVGSEVGRVEYVDLPALIAALVVAEDQLGDAR